MTTSLQDSSLAAGADASGRRGSVQNPVVRCLSAGKIFRDFWWRSKAKAVDGVTFDIRPGEVFGLLGPNGAGKSTTIKLILGLLHPTSGRVLVFDKAPTDVGTKRRIGYLPEDSYLYRFLNARETLDYYARLFHLPASQRRARIDKLLEMVGLEGVQRRAVGEYSKGMQRRIGLAQALINDPDLLILDEPTTGMDPIGTRQIKDLILELASRGKTILLCSHLLADVEDVCDRVAIMYGGKVRALGTTEELLTRQDQTMIQTPVLESSLIEEIEQLLEKRGKHLEKVLRPRQTLEAFFLDIVTRAQDEGLQTSGARSGGAIADFLTSSSAGASASQAASDGAAVAKQIAAAGVSIAPAVQGQSSASGDVADSAAGAAGGGSAVSSGAVGGSGSVKHEEPDQQAIADLMGGSEKELTAARDVVDSLPGSQMKQPEADLSFLDALTEVSDEEGDKKDLSEDGKAGSKVSGSDRDRNKS